MRAMVMFLTLGLLGGALFGAAGFFGLDMPGRAVRASALHTDPPSTSGPASPTSLPAPTASPTVCLLTFGDVPPDNPFYAYIQCLACRGVVSGYACGAPSEPCPGIYYRPGNNVTRGQTSKIVSNAAGLADLVPSAQQTFADVPPGNPFWHYVEQLAGRGIIGGYACGQPGEPCVAPQNAPYFRPNTAVTRGQLSKLVAEGAGYNETPSGQTFEDVPPSSPFYLYVERLAARGTLSGYPCGEVGEPCVAPTNRPYVRPANNATRGQMAKIAAQSFAFTWGLVPGADPGLPPHVLQGVAAVSASDIWAVGLFPMGGSWAELREHWNGAMWSVVPGPSPEPPGANLHGVAAVAADDVWAVGTYWNGSVRHMLVEHWDGTTWSLVPSPDTGADVSTLYSVAARAADDIWAVGTTDNASGNATQTLTVHWDGLTWSVVPGPTPAAPINTLASVAAVAADDVWAVGVSWNGSTEQTLVEHWDGASWSVVPSPSPGANFNELRGVTAVAADDVWAVGYYATSSALQTLVLHWDGSSWSSIPTPNPGTLNYNFQGVTARSAHDIWAVGSALQGTNRRTLVEHWNGSQWSIVASPNAAADINHLMSVAPLSTGDVWAVGYSGNSGAEQALIEQYAQRCP